MLLYNFSEKATAANDTEEKLFWQVGEEHLGILFAGGRNSGPVEFRLHQSQRCPTFPNSLPPYFSSSFGLKNLKTDDLLPPPAAALHSSSD